MKCRIPSLIIGLCMGFVSLTSMGQESSILDSEQAARFAPALNVAFDPQVSQSGWFALSPDGDTAVSISIARELLIWDMPTETLLANLPCADFVHANFGAEDVLIAACMLDDGFELVRWQSQAEAERQTISLAYYPIQVWIGADEAIYAELQAIRPEDSAQVMRLVWGEVPELRPYPPEQDETGVVRIGRIMPPYVVTSSLDGIVSLWDMERGERLAQVDNGTGKPSVFGNINASASHLVWRDNDNQSLYVLDWQTGTNRLIADLGGAYVQWFFLSMSADVILGVGVAGAPNVVAWDVATGAQMALGDYHAERPCSRPQPDMAHFSADGRRLAIGCDAGIEIWQTP